MLSPPRRASGTTWSRSAEPICRTRHPSPWARNGRVTPACWRTIWTGSAMRSRESTGWPLAARPSAPGSMRRRDLPRRVRVGIPGRRSNRFLARPKRFPCRAPLTRRVRPPGPFPTPPGPLSKIGNDIRLMSCGPRAGFAELMIPENEPGSSIMPGKVNPTQAEALTMIAVQVMANDVAVGFGGAGGYLEMNVYKPLIIANLVQSITLLSDGCTNFRRFLVEGTQPNRKKIAEYVERSLMLVTALAPVIGYDKASKIAHHAVERHLTLKAAALQLGFVV